LAYAVPNLNHTQPLIYALTAFLKNSWYKNKEESTKCYIPNTSKGEPGSVVGIATGYGLDGPGIESRWGGEIFRTYPHWVWGPLSLLYNGYWVFPGGKKRPGRDADPSPPSSAAVKKV